MQKFEVTILGCSSATPTSKRNPSSQLVNIAEQYFLIDCGEGTQMQLRRFKIKFQRINHIFISHLHGDHYYGLIGLLSSMHLLGRTANVHLYGPPALKNIIDLQLNYSETKLHYNLIFHPLNNTAPQLIFEDEKISIQTILLNHRISCTGFLFREKEKPRKISMEKITAYKIPHTELNNIKQGSDFVTKEGAVIPNEKITTAQPLYSYAYCSDTCYDEKVIEQVKSVDVLYHEATFMEDMHDRAAETFHSTAKQAANVAAKAAVKKLIIGHYSARYKDLQPLLAEAQSVFANTALAVEGDNYLIMS
ncbi:MAG: ribonuclease Z [Bacteroidia bacterium]|nr:ribonuclease Z [Bacteroidia bacterium]